MVHPHCLFYFFHYQTFVVSGRRTMTAAESSCKKDGLCSLTAQKLTADHVIPGPGINQSDNGFEI